MEYLKRLLTLQFLFLVAIPMALGEIIVDIPEKNVYNLGEKVIPTVSIKEDQDYSGFFKLSIFCDNYDLQYYTIPLSLEADFRTQLTVPELSLAESMTSKCRLKANFELSDGDRIDSAWSEYFFVTDELNITVDSSLEAKPGEDVIILGQIKKQSNELMPKGEAKISFRSEENKIDIISGKFEHVIYLEGDVETGNIPLLIVATDQYGNYGDKILSLKVLPIPTRIESRIENNVLLPGDTLKARVILYDHSNKAINGSKVNVKIFDSNENVMAEKDIQNMNYFELKTEKKQMPGRYFLTSAFENIKEQSSFEVEAVRKIITKQEGNFVHVENVGNVEYKDEITITLESDDKNYLINKKIDLGPEEKITIDLSKYVPQGTYDIILPEETVEEDTAVDDNNESENTREIVEHANVIEDVEIDDNRNVIKKTADGMSSITGAVAGVAGYVASKPLLVAIILVLITFGTLTYYSWSFIKNRVRRKKDETNHLFEDFKYEDNKPGD